MLMVWKGKGFLVALVAMTTFALMQLGTNGIGGPGTYEGNALFWGGVTLLVAGLVLIGLGQKLHLESNQFFFDPKTNEPITLGRADTMLFIPVRIWGALFCAAGAALTFAGLA